MDMVAGLPSKDVPSLDAPFCAVTVSLRDVMKENSFFHRLCSGLLLSFDCFYHVGRALCR
jgi:hypothetical protein